MSSSSDDENDEFYDASDGTNDIQKTWDELMVCEKRDEKQLKTIDYF